MYLQAWAAWLCRAATLAVASREATAVAVAGAWASSSMVGEEEGTMRCACCCSGP